MIDAVSFGVVCEKDLFSLNCDKHGMKCLRTGSAVLTRRKKEGNHTCEAMQNDAEQAQNMNKSFFFK